MQRRNLIRAAAALAAGATRAQPHSGAHHTLPVAPSSPDPYAKLQGGVPHHMTPELEATHRRQPCAGPRQHGLGSTQSPAVITLRWTLCNRL